MQPTERPGTIHRATVIALLLVGLTGWFFLFGRQNFLIFGTGGPASLTIFVLIVIALVLIPPTRNMLASALNAIRFPSPLTRCISTFGLGFASAIYLFLTAYQQRRLFSPYLHDEFSYLIQAHQLARGQLWMPVHPLAAFFDSFQLLVQPVYASAYFPGTTMLYVPGIWLHLPPWLTSLIICGAIAGLLFRIVTELIDGVAGSLAVVLLLACQMFRELSLMTMAQTPVLLYGLLAMFAWLKWRKNNGRTWAFLLGGMLALAAVTRPVDALCFIIPIGIFFLIDLRNRSKSVQSLILMVLGIVPLLSLQLILNKGITGYFFETPFRLYADRDHPNTSYGFHRYDPSARPASDLPQKQALYEKEYLPLIEQHQPKHALSQTLGYRLPLTLSLASSTPFPLLVILIPVAFAGLTRSRAALVFALPLFIGLYAFYVFFEFHYVVAVAPAVILCILIGAETITNSFNNIRLFLPLIIAGLSIAALPQFDPGMVDQMFDAPLIRAVNTKLKPLDHAVVLFRYSQARNVHEEPVYNSDVAWPDDAPVIRAHDRGKQNVQVFDYYAQHQPDRKFYRFDESDYVLTYLGTARELAGMSP